MLGFIGLLALVAVIPILPGRQRRLASIAVDKSEAPMGHVLSQAMRLLPRGYLATLIATIATAFSSVWRLPDSLRVAGFAVAMLLILQLLRQLPFFGKLPTRLYASFGGFRILELHPARPPQLGRSLCDHVCRLNAASGCRSADSDRPRPWLYDRRRHFNRIFHGDPALSDQSRLAAARGKARLGPLLPAAFALLPIGQRVPGLLVARPAQARARRPPRRRLPSNISQQSA